MPHSQDAWAWVDESARIDFTALTGGHDVHAVNFDGGVVAVGSLVVNTFRNTGIVLWNAMQGTGPSAFTNIDSLRYCVDLPLTDFWGGQARDRAQALP